VGKSHRRIVEAGLDDLHDEPCPRGSCKIGNEGIEAVIVPTLESLPQNATHRSSREMAKISRISTSSV
jgi:hypothetical protein